MRKIVSMHGKFTCHFDAIDMIVMQVPEVHGYALSLLKNDYQNMFGHELNHRHLGTSKMSEIVFAHARDIATVVITQVEKTDVWG
jgi:hypothetical protein